MPIDMDPFHSLDINFDHHVDAHDLETYELIHHGDIHDLNHDGIMDQFQMDLNHDMQIDQFQADLDHNHMIDKFETQMPGTTTFDYDINHDGEIDYIDTALAKSIFNK